MYNLLNDYTFRSEYSIRNDYVITHIPEVLSTHDLGTVLFEDAPSNISNKLNYIDTIKKLTR